MRLVLRQENSLEVANTDAYGLPCNAPDRRSNTYVRIGPVLATLLTWRGLYSVLFKKAANLSQDTRRETYINKSTGRLLYEEI